MILQENMLEILKQFSQWVDVDVAVRVHHLPY